VCANHMSFINRPCKEICQVAARLSPGRPDQAAELSCFDLVALCINCKQSSSVGTL